MLLKMQQPLFCGSTCNLQKIIIEKDVLHNHPQVIYYIVYLSTKICKCVFKFLNYYGQVLYSIVLKVQNL